MRQSISLVIAIILASAIVATSVALTYVSINQLRQALESEYIRSVESNYNALLLMVHAKHPGEWSIVNGEMYKGTSPVADWQDFIDDIAQATGGVYSVFAGSTRIATNVHQDGKRQLGTQISEAVAEQVLHKGNKFEGTANVLGIPHHTVYLPIRDKSQQIIGVIATGIPISALDAAIAKTTRGIILWSVIVSIIAVVIAFVITRSYIIIPLQKVSSVVSMVANGDLTPRIKLRSRNEIGVLATNVDLMTQSLNSLVGTVSKIATDLGAHSEELAAASEEVAASSQDMASTSAQVAASVAQGSASTVEVASTASSMSDNARHGEVAAQSALEMMSKVSSLSISTDTAMVSLANQTQEIAVITEEIRNIADQTNLLALNAAIEAARAGEHGRGFAVVADAVRQLAQQSSAATKQIGSIIAAIIDGTTTATKAVSNVSAAINQAEKTVTTASLALGDISKRVSELSLSIKEVATGSDQASQGAEHLAASIQEVSATSQEMASAAQGLAHMAEKLQQEVARFVI